MTESDGFDRQITRWLSDSAGTTAPGYLDETLNEIGSLPQRSVLAFPGRWLPVSVNLPRPAAGRGTALLAVLALLIVAGLAAFIAVGTRPRVPTLLPPPFGLARPGLIAFDKDGQIVLANPDGGGTRPLHPSDSTQFGATFSRDGTRVAFWQEDGWKMVHGLDLQKASDLWVVDVDGSDAVNLTPDLEVAPWPGAPAGSWSPDGRSFVFTSDKDAPMYVVPTDGSAPPRAIGDGFVMPFHPAWSPDGSLIAFAGPERLPDDALGPSKVYVINPNGTGQEQVSRDGAGDGTGALPAWSPDGRMLLYGVDVTAPSTPGSPPKDGPSTRVEIVTAERGSTGWTERVVAPPSAIWASTFSNDGSRIAFLRSRPGQFGGDLFAVGVDGSGERMVSDRLVNVSVPCWSPDDRSIAMLTGPIPPGGEAAAFGWPDQSYTLFPAGSGKTSEIPAGRVDGVFACSWQRLAP
jgi:Tol biopolymer transport system component